MLEHGRITSRQLIWLITVSILPTLLLFIPGIVISDARQDAWLAALAAPVLALVLLWFPARLAALFPDRTVVGYGRILLGRWGGACLGISLAAWSVFTTAIVLRQLSEITITMFFEETPLILLMGLLLALVAWAVRGGIEVIARVNDALLISFFLPIVGLMALAIPEFEGTNLIPILAAGLAPPALAVYHSIIFFAGAALTFLMLFPVQQRAAGGYRSLALCLAVLGVVQLLTLVVILGVSGPGAGSQRFPLLEVVRYLQLAENVVERLDALLLFLWLANGFVQVSLFYYAAVVAAAEALGLRAYQFLTLPVGLLVAVVALRAFPDISYIRYLLMEPLPPLYLALEVGLPVLLLLVAWARGYVRHGS